MKVKQILLNPFAEFMEWKLFFVGVFGFLLSSYFIYLSGQQFNGFMHFYQPEMTVSLWAVMRVHAYMVLAPFTLLYAIGTLLNRKTRIIDVMNVILIMPFPLYLALFLGKLLNQDKFSDEVLKAVQSGDHTLEGVDKTEMLFFGMFGIISLLMLFYQFYLLVKGMNVAVNNKKIGISILFVGLYFILDLCIQFYF
ncbi:YIP1 family protein [Sphingobacterium sp. UBA1498]|uniref:YIP1 family protein n=1 Tax=Sphingobacterium sp. UBA1498 TaxID=1947481 RepID=UPI0025F4E896|nr:YIP1 family protein [Sphingobacterium sp. UBA1498]